VGPKASVDAVKNRKFLPLPEIKLEATLDAAMKGKLLPLPGIKPQFHKYGL
jgi:hypothetical protein